MESSIVEWSETTPAWEKNNTSCTQLHIQLYLQYLSSYTYRHIHTGGLQALKRLTAFCVRLETNNKPKVILGEIESQRCISSYNF